MSEVNIYDETENLISSDDSSDDSDREDNEDEEDDLMNAAVSSKIEPEKQRENTPVKTATPTTQYQRPGPASSKKAIISPPSNKLNEIKLLIKKKKYVGSFKKRSIKWLNNRQTRDKYKNNLLELIKKSSEICKTMEIKSQNIQIPNNEQVNRKEEEVDELDDNETHSISTSEEESDDNEYLDEEEDMKSSCSSPRSVNYEKKLGNGNISHVSDTIELNDSDVELSPQKPNHDQTLKEHSITNLRPADIPTVVNLPSNENADVDIPKIANVSSNAYVTAEIIKDNIVIKDVPSSSTPLSTPVAIAASDAAAVPTIKCNKRARSVSPLPEDKPEIATPRASDSKAKEADSATANNAEKLIGPSLYKEINAMFPKHDEILSKHLKTTSNSTLDVIETNMTRILQDIQTINDCLEAREQEWNKLLHLKKVKEEILTRLVRKKHIVEMKEKHPNDSAYSLMELKELERFFSSNDDNNTLKVNSFTSSNNGNTIQQLLENRANMKSDELERERSNTNRLQSFLISSNILSKSDKSAKHQNSSQYPSHQYLENKHKLNPAVMGRQGPIKEVKSIIADFRQKNPDILPRVGKRIKLNEHTFRNLNKNSLTASANDQQHFSLEPTSNYTPTLEKLLSSSGRSNEVYLKRSIPHSQGFKFSNNNDGQHRQYAALNSNDELCNEISITPVEGRFSQDYKGNMLRTALHANVDQKVMYIDTANYGRQPQPNFKDPEGNVPLCQECKSHEARFVCAGCGNQWYCSRNCQVTAWDKHSESCSE